MSPGNVEQFPYGGESPTDPRAFQRYMEDCKRGKSLLLLIEVRDAATPQIRNAWSARSFTDLQTTQGLFPGVVCNISYHFLKHGAKFGSIAGFTNAAQLYFRQNRVQAKVENGMLRFPNNTLFELDGRIITFF